MAMPTQLPAVIWLTGLSGAGKSTIASALYRAVSAREVPVECLDGDVVRMFAPTGFSRQDRDAHVLRVGFLASRLEAHGVTVICALISPYAEARRQVRSFCRRFIEIHVSTPLAECVRRDPKGLYAKVHRGEISNFTGISDPYEAPVLPDLVLDTSRVSLEDAVQSILSRLAPARMTAASRRLTSQSEAAAGKFQ